MRLVLLVLLLTAVMCETTLNQDKITEALEKRKRMIKRVR